MWEIKMENNYSNPKNWAATKYNTTQHVTEQGGHTTGTNAKSGTNQNISRQ